MPIDPRDPFARSFPEAQAQKNADLHRRLAQLERAGLSMLAGEKWHTVDAAGQPAFLADWVNNAAEPAGFYRDGSGLVHLRGEAYSAAEAHGGDVYYLPAGYRPAYNIKRSTYGSTSQFGALELAQLRVRTDGLVSVTVGFNTVAVVSFGGVYFRAAEYE